MGIWPQIWVRDSACALFHPPSIFSCELWPQVKSSRRDITTVVTFRAEVGSMSPIVSCKEHNTRREVYGICETNEAGEVIITSLNWMQRWAVVQTALQVYCKYYKQAPTHQAHDLLRKARRLDQVLMPQSQNQEEASDSLFQPHCHKCKTEYSPFFYPIPNKDDFLCQRCETDDACLVSWTLYLVPVLVSIISRA
jgi:hypothetical protein